MFHISRSTQCLQCLVLCFLLRWSTTAAARPSSAAGKMEVEAELTWLADMETCKLSQGNYTTSNLSEIQCANKTLEDVLGAKQNSSDKLVFPSGVSVRIVGEGLEGESLNEDFHAYALQHEVLENLRTQLALDISLSPGATLYLEAVHFIGKIEVFGNETATVQSKVSNLMFVNCKVDPPVPDVKQKALAKLEGEGVRDPSASGWSGWLILRNAALTLQINGSHFTGDVFVEQSTFNFSASKSVFQLKDQGFQLVNGTSFIKLDAVSVSSGREHPSFKLRFGRHELHVARSYFSGSAFDIRGGFAKALDIILDVRDTSLSGPRAIVVSEVHTVKLHLAGVYMDGLDSGVEIRAYAGNVHIDHSRIEGPKQTAMYINFRNGSRASVKLENVVIEDAGTGLYADGAKFSVKNLRISRVERGIWLRGSAEFEAKAVTVEQAHRQGINGYPGASATIQDLKISQTQTALSFNNPAFHAAGVSISKCRVVVSCERCDSVSMEDVIIAENDKVLERRDWTKFQVTSGLVLVLNSWDFMDFFRFNKGGAASLLVWSWLPCPLAIALSCCCCISATVLSRMGLERYFSGGFGPAHGQRWKYVLAGASLLLWILVVQAMVAAILLYKMRWTYGHQEYVQEHFVRPYAKIWLTSLMTIFAAAIIYLYVTVVQRRADIKTLADLKRTEMLLQQKDGLKASLDNIELREEMDQIQLQMFLATKNGDQAKVQETFNELKSKAAEEASRLSKWYETRRACYASEDAGARLKTLEGIPSQSLAEAVQLPLPMTDEGESLDILCGEASWLRSNFKDQLLKVCTDLNGINSRADLQSLGFNEMQFDPATHPLQPEANATVGKHVGLLVAPVKSKDRAQAKVMTDYKEDQSAGKKSELPLARYVCDFLRATIFASDPYVLAVAFWQLQKEFKFVRVKNKFGEEGLRPELRTNILVNLWVKHGDCAQIGEVQFLLQDYLTAKSLQHLYYDVARAAKPEELWDKPIFR